MVKRGVLEELKLDWFQMGQVVMCAETLPTTLLCRRRELHLLEHIL